jgi:hypothetical protein
MAAVGFAFFDHARLHAVNLSGFVQNGDDELFLAVRQDQSVARFEDEIRVASRG